MSREEKDRTELQHIIHILDSNWERKIWVLQGRNWIDLMIFVDNNKSTGKYSTYTEKYRNWLHWNPLLNIFGFVDSNTQNDMYDSYDNQKNIEKNTANWKILKIFFIERKIEKNSANWKIEKNTANWKPNTVMTAKKMQQLSKKR